MPKGVISSEALAASEMLSKAKKTLARSRKKGRAAIFEDPNKPTVEELRRLEARPVKDALLYTAPLTDQDLKNNAGKHFLFRGANRAARRSYGRSLGKIRDMRGVPPKKRRNMQALTVEDRFRGSKTVLGILRPVAPQEAAG